MALRDGGVTRRVLGSKTNIIYRDSDRCGLEYTYENTDVWYLTWRTWADVEAMHATLEPTPVIVESEDREREIFGETLDDPIQDDLWDMLMSY